MPKILQVAPHLNSRELKSRYLRCRNVEERERLHCVLLKLQGRRSSEIAALFLRKEDWVRRTVRRYNELGPDGMKDQRQHNGSSRLLSDDDMAALDDALQGLAPDGGLWSGPKVALWIAERTGKDCSNQTGWKYLKRLGYSVQRPRPKHPEANQEAQEDFKKGGSLLGFRALLMPIETP